MTGTVLRHVPGTGKNTGFVGTETPFPDTPGRVEDNKRTLGTPGDSSTDVAGPVQPQGPSSGDPLPPVSGPDECFEDVGLKQVSAHVVCTTESRTETGHSVTGSGERRPP